MKTEVEQELLDRARRTESRLVTLGQALNVDLMDLARQQKAVYGFDTTRGHHVTVQSLDVPLARIIKAGREGTGARTGNISVYYEDKLVAVVAL